MESYVARIDRRERAHSAGRGVIVGKAMQDGRRSCSMQGLWQKVAIAGNAAAIARDAPPQAIGVMTAKVR